MSEDAVTSEFYLKRFQGGKSSFRISLSKVSFVAADWPRGRMSRLGGTRSFGPVS